MNGICWRSPGCMKRLFADLGVALFDSKTFFPVEFQSSFRVASADGYGIASATEAAGRSD
jgi:hypothetical protein